MSDRKIVGGCAHHYVRALFRSADARDTSAGCPGRSGQ